MAQEFIIADSVTSRVVTSEMIDAVPYGFRVQWIKWDSGFRGSGLAIGDRIIGVDGERYDRATRDRNHHKAIGQYAESQRWSGVAEGTRTTLVVWRRGETSEVSGTVRADRTWRDAANHMLMSSDGPDRYERDGFSDAWMTWYDRFVEFAWRWLDGGWRQFSGNNRTLLKQHLENRPRVDLLVQKYPGRFAQTANEDWEAVRLSLDGTRYAITDAELAYRQLGEARAAQIAAASKTARQKFLDEHAAERIEPFPAIDPIGGDRESVTGKLVALPPIHSRDWMMSAGRPWLSATDGRGWYFLDGAGAPMRRFFMTAARYRAKVAPNLAEVYSCIGRIQPNPRMMVSGGAALTGLVAEPVAAGVDGALFVDLTVDGEEAPFAGEAQLDAIPTPEVPPDAPPEQVMAAFFNALKQGAVEPWRKFFATWRASRGDDRVYYYPFYPLPNSLPGEWERARRQILGDVYDVRVVAVDPIVPLMTGGEFEGAPTIDEVVVEVDHVGRFDGEYRSFKNVNVHRLWTLQRQDGGPWRIAVVQGL